MLNTLINNEMKFKFSVKKNLKNCLAYFCRIWMQFVVDQLSDRIYIQIIYRSYIILAFAMKKR
ncbi:hypothetical protein A4E14_20960 [Salmonella enterica]|nr:hypothetical protein LFZ55_24735 [Salmonella enterica subsp. diarizonae serovar 65:c:z str. SA20044251]EBL7166878.1 hypothetical protein [Salmonella enterica]ECT6514812.1 hypothetical protein [Salmonella enterica]